MKTLRRMLTVRSIMAIASSLIVLTVIIVGICFLDSPAQERLRRLDERRVSDLRALSFAIDAHWTREGQLPSSLDNLSNEDRIARGAFDPETGDPYEYRIVDEDSYELWATFVTEKTGGDPYFSDLWHHGTGRQCFTLTAQNVERGPPGNSR